MSNLDIQSRQSREYEQTHLFTHKETGAELWLPLEPNQNQILRRHVQTSEKAI